MTATYFSRASLNHRLILWITDCLTIGSQRGPLNNSFLVTRHFHWFPSLRSLLSSSSSPQTSVDRHCEPRSPGPRTVTVGGVTHRERKNLLVIFWFWFKVYFGKRPDSPLYIRLWLTLDDQDAWIRHSSYLRLFLNVLNRSATHNTSQLN